MRRYPTVDEAWKASLRKLEHHVSPIEVIDFSPDGRLFAFASNSQKKDIQLWDSDTGTFRGIIEGDEIPLKVIAFSPNGQLLATASLVNLFMLWNPNTRAFQRTLRGNPIGIKAVMFSPDSQLIATISSDRSIRLWDTNTGALQRELVGHLGSINVVAFSPGGHVLASASCDETIRLWNPATGALTKVLDGPFDSANALVFSPTDWILACASDNGDIWLWDATLGYPIQQINRYEAQNILFSRDGSYLNVDGTSYKVQRPSPTPLVPIQASTGPLYSIDIESEWIIYKHLKVLRLPPGHRSTRYAFRENLLAIAEESGNISFYRFSKTGPFVIFEPVVVTAAIVPFDGRLMVSLSDNSDFR